MERLRFSVLIEEDDDGFSVSCPVFQGCYSQGATQEEALKNIEDAIRLHIEDRRANHEDTPKQRSVSLSTVEVLLP